MYPGAIEFLNANGPNRIDLITSISGVSFGDAWANRVYSLLVETKIRAARMPR